MVVVTQNNMRNHPHSRLERGRGGWCPWASSCCPLILLSLKFIIPSCCLVVILLLSLSHCVVVPSCHLVVVLSCCCLILLSCCPVVLLSCHLVILLSYRLIILSSRRSVVLLLLLSSFHPQSTPQAVAHEAGCGWCALSPSSTFLFPLSTLRVVAHSSGVGVLFHCRLVVVHPAVLVLSSRCHCCCQK